LYANRSFTHARIARSQDASTDERQQARVNALQDAMKATELGGEMGKSLDSTGGSYAVDYG